jgi:SNF2 family DNA or RNA helicase
VSVIVAKGAKQLLVPHTEAVKNLFPCAPELDNYAVVPHGLRETLMLRHIGFRVPNPQLTYYDWRGGKPFEVQKRTFSLLTSNNRAYVLNHMGTGKTKVALWAWDSLYSDGYAQKALVVAPLSTLNFVWAREVFATLPHRKAVVLHGSKKHRLDLLRGDADIYIINHDGVKVIEEELSLRTDIDVLILDELAVYRNNSQRSKRMRTFAQRFNWVWGMTGAPMPNEPTDVWSQCKIVTPSTVPKYFKQAQEVLMNRVNQFKWVPKPDAVETAFRMMQPSVRYALDDVVELPEIISRTIDVDLSPEQKKAYEKLVKEFRVLVEGKAINAMNAAAAMSKLTQVALGWVYTTSPEFVKLDSSPRMEALLEIVEGAANKVLVFVPFLHATEGISELFTNHTIEHAVVHGGTKDRDQIFNLFQNTAKYKVLLAHPQCLSHGLTLTVADTVVWVSPVSSLEMYDQANARIRRVGQKHKQQILHLQATPVERRIYTLLRNKQTIQDKLLNLFEEATGRAT